MAMICTLTRSVLCEGWLSPAKTPVAVLGVTREGKARCRADASVGPNGDTRNDLIIEVLPEEIRFESLRPTSRD